MIIPALDFNSPHEAYEMARSLRDLVSGVKVGMELFHLRGPEVFNSLRVVSKIDNIFYDGKLSDIPTTIERTLKVIAHFDIWMTTVQSRGGVDMVRAAVEGARLGAEEFSGVRVPKILVVGAFTSMSDPMGHALVETTLTALSAGAAGIICPPHLAHIARGIATDEGKPDFLIVCPGVRPEGCPDNDHSATMNPLRTKRNGANYLVIGRPITCAPDPREAVLDIIKSMEEPVDLPEDSNDRKI